jgi:tyrosine-protein phosphatase SIW14
MFYPFALAPTAEPTPRTPQHDYKALPNLHAVHSYLLRGGQPTPAGLAELKQMGVSTVIDLRRNRQNILAEQMYTQQLGLKYISLPMGNFVPSGNKQKQYLNALECASADPKVGKVFVHCSHGSDRTGFMVALWRVTHDGWSIAEAAAEAINHGFVIHRFRKDDDGKMFD